MPKLSKKEIEHLARLARLELTEDEKKLYSEQLSSVLDYFNKLEEVNTEKVEITSQVTGLENITREDKVVDSGVEKELIKEAPDQEDNQIKVKAVL